MKKMWYTQTMVYYSVLKKKDILPIVKMGMNPKDIRISEIR